MRTSGEDSREWRQCPIVEKPDGRLKVRNRMPATIDLRSVPNYVSNQALCPLYGATNETEFSLHSRSDPLSLPQRLAHSTVIFAVPYFTRPIELELPFSYHNHIGSFCLSTYSLTYSSYPHPATMPLFHLYPTLHYPPLFLFPCSPLPSFRLLS